MESSRSRPAKADGRSTDCGTSRPRAVDGNRSAKRCEQEQTLWAKAPATVPNAPGTDSWSVQSKAERNLAHGLGEVRRIASVLELSGSVRDQACQLFRSAQTEDLLRGRSIEAIAAASIYGACRCNGHSRLLDDVVDAARVEQSRVANAYKTLNTELGLPTQPVRPSEFIPVSRRNSIFSIHPTASSSVG